MLPSAESTAVVLDELASLGEHHRRDLAYFINRYLKKVALQPLTLQVLMDIVERAATDVDVVVPRRILMRIAKTGVYGIWESTLVQPGAALGSDESTASELRGSEDLCARHCGEE
jgi:hypothetical protein